MDDLEKEKFFNEFKAKSKKESKAQFFENQAKLLLDVDTVDSESWSYIQRLPSMSNKHMTPLAKRLYVSDDGKLLRIKRPVFKHPIAGFIFLIPIFFLAKMLLSVFSMNLGANILFAIVELFVFPVSVAAVFLFCVMLFLYCLFSSNTAVIKYQQVTTSFNIFGIPVRSKTFYGKEVKHFTFKATDRLSLDKRVVYERFTIYVEAGINKRFELAETVAGVPNTLLLKEYIEKRFYGDTARPY